MLARIRSTRRNKSREGPNDTGAAPDRRFAETVAIEHGGTRFMVTIGFYPDGRPGEVFTHGLRSGSISMDCSPTPASSSPA